MSQQRIAFILSSNGPNNSEQLKHANDDARIISEVLSKEEYGFNVFPETKPISNKKYEILEKLSDIIAKCKSNDDFIFYFSGHGNAQYGKLYLILDETTFEDKSSVERTSLPIGNILDEINNCKAKNILIILDCCHGGAIHHKYKSDKNEDYSPTEFKTFIDNNTSYHILLASDKLEKTREVEIKLLEQSEPLRGGFLTLCLYRALIEKPREVLDGEGNISIFKLNEWLKTETEQFNKEEKNNSSSKIPVPFITESKVKGKSFIFNKTPLVDNSKIINENTAVDIDTLLVEIRRKIRHEIQHKCGTMHVLDMTDSIGLYEIYTDVKILEKVTGKLWVEYDDMLSDFDPNAENFDRRWLGKVTSTRLPGLEVVERHPKLMVLGKPGAGKTTFLKYIAIQCLSKKFQVNRIPIFITLKEFTEDKNKLNLLKFITKKYDLKREKVITLLDHGRILLLLDGLDEVQQENNTYLIEQINLFAEKYFFSSDFKLDQLVIMSEHDKRINESEKNRDSTIEQARERRNQNRITLEEFQEIYETAKIEFEHQTKEIYKQYPDLLKSSDQGLDFLSNKFPKKIYNNHFVITCRIAARDYIFQNFVEVEVADFDDQQIRSFVNNWFGRKDPLKGKKFLKKIAENKPIKELASSPLLLTLLCLVFEETADFPINRSELYNQGVSTLLEKWDADRNITRDQVYKNLSVERKKNLLSSIAFTTFKQADYFFRQNQVEFYIKEYIKNLPKAITDEQTLELDSKAVLKSIESQHGLLVERARGIYSFSHLTFQEYLTARKIITTSEPQELEEALNELSTHFTEKRWLEVLLLALGMLPSAERLLKLIKEKVDNLLANDHKLQKFLFWVDKKSLDYINYKPEAIRCIYFCIGCDLSRDIPKTRSKVLFSEPDIDRVLELVKALDIRLVDDIANERDITNPIIRDFVVTRDLARDFARDLACNPRNIPGFKNKEKEVFLTLIKKLPDFTKQESFITEWWQNNGDNWIQQFRKVLIYHYNIGHDWQFNAQQRALLKKYYNANNMLFECLNECYVKLEVRQEIINSLFLPVNKELCFELINDSADSPILDNSSSEITNIPNSPELASLEDLQSLTLKRLKELAKLYKIPGFYRMKEEKLVTKLHGLATKEQIQ